MVNKQIKRADKIIQQAEAYGYFSRGTFYLTDKKYNNAINDFTKAIKKDNKLFLAYFNRANALMAMTDYIQSIDNGSKSVISLRNNTTQDKSETIVDYTSAIKDYSKTIQLNDKFAFAIYNRGNAYAKSKKFKKAIADYDWAIQLEPNFKEAYYNRGLVYLFLHNNSLAYEDLSKAGELGLLNAYNVIKRYCNKSN